MLRPPFGHRRYSITHRAVQRLRELVQGLEGDDDEGLRDRLDEALAEQFESGNAVRTLDAMLGEPQTLVPVDRFGDRLYAIIKEDTVVTVLPQSHGEEILQRGQAMEQRVLSGDPPAAAAPPPPASGPRPGERPAPTERERPLIDRDDEAPRRRWRKDAASTVVVERIVRGAAPGGGVISRIESVGAIKRDHEDGGSLEPEETASSSSPAAKVVDLPRRTANDGPVADTLMRALDRGRRRAAVSAITETLARQHHEAALLPLWNELANEGIPASLTVGDLIEAVSALPR